MKKVLYTKQVIVLKDYSAMRKPCLNLTEMRRYKHGDTAVRYISDRIIWMNGSEIKCLSDKEKKKYEGLETLTCFCKVTNDVKVMDIKSKNFCKIECEMEYDISDSSRVKSVSCFKLQRFYSSKKSFRVHKVKYVSTHTEQGI